MEFVSEATVERNGEFPTVEYRLIRSTRSLGEAISNVYSVLCISHTDDGLTDEAFVYDISSDRDTASRIFTALTSGAVTPLTVADVVEDYLAGLMDQLG